MAKLIDKSGVTVFDGVIAGTVQFATVSLSSAEILALNSSPVQIVPAPPADSVIAVANAVGVMSFGTVAYDTNTRIDLVYDVSSVSAWFSVHLLPAVADALVIKAASSINGAPPADLLGRALLVSADGGDPATGDGTLVLTVAYQLLTFA